MAFTSKKGPDGLSTLVATSNTVPMIDKSAVGRAAFGKLSKGDRIVKLLNYYLDTDYPDIATYMANTDPDERKDDLNVLHYYTEGTMEPDDEYFESEGAVPSKLARKLAKAIRRDFSLGDEYSETDPDTISDWWEELKGGNELSDDTGEANLDAPNASIKEPSGKAVGSIDIENIPIDPEDNLSDRKTKETKK